MPDDDRIRLPPTMPDLVVARTIARHTTKPAEKALGVATWLADEKVVTVAALALWAYCRLGVGSPRAKRCADRIICDTAVATALPHIVKRFVDRERPDRKVVHGRRRGIPRSGNRWDSFPSGHAVHLGALAAAASRFVPPRLWPIVWLSALSLATTRLLLLAHYPTDVAAGLAIGIGVDRGVGAVLSRVDTAT